MTKADLVELLKDRQDLPRNHAEHLVDLLLEVLKGTLDKGETVLISGFGKFYVRHKKARMGRNPQTGEPFEIAPRRVIKFQYSPALKAFINNRDHAGRKV